MVATADRGGPRRARDGHVVDEAARPRAHRLETRPIARRGEQEDHVETGGVGGELEVVRLFGRHVDAEDAVGAARSRVTCQPLRPVAQERIGVSEEHDRNRRVAAELGDELEHARERGADGERTLGRALQGRPVRHGVRERHAELDQIGSGVDGGAQELAGHLEARVARHDERREARPALRREPRERLADATHGCPSALSRRRMPR